MESSDSTVGVICGSSQERGKYIKSNGGGGNDNKVPCRLFVSLRASKRRMANKARYLFPSYCL